MRPRPFFVTRLSGAPLSPWDQQLAPQRVHLSTLDLAGRERDLLPLAAIQSSFCRWLAEQAPVERPSQLAQPQILQRLFLRVLGTAFFAVLVLRRCPATTCDVISQHLSVQRTQDDILDRDGRSKGLPPLACNHMIRCSGVAWQSFAGDLPSHSAQPQSLQRREEREKVGF